MHPITDHHGFRRNEIKLCKNVMQQIRFDRPRAIQLRTIYPLKPMAQFEVFKDWLDIDMGFGLSDKLTLSGRRLRRE